MAARANQSQLLTRAERQIYRLQDGISAALVWTFADSGLTSLTEPRLWILSIPFVALLGFGAWRARKSPA